MSSKTNYTKDKRHCKFYIIFGLTGCQSCKYGKYILPLKSTYIETLIIISEVGFT